MTQTREAMEALAVYERGVNSEEDTLVQDLSNLQRSTFIYENSSTIWVLFF